MQAARAQEKLHYLKDCIDYCVQEGGLRESNLQKESLAKNVDGVFCIQAECEWNTHASQNKMTVQKKILRCTRIRNSLKAVETLKRQSLLNSFETLNARVGFLTFVVDS